MVKTAPLFQDFPVRAHPPLSQDEKMARLRLIRTDTIGPITFQGLIQEFETAEKAIEALPDLAKRGGRMKPLKIPTCDEIHQEWMALNRFGGTFLFLGDALYPPCLASIDDAPPVLSIKGNGDLLTRRTIGVVGARNASLNGQRFAQKLSQELADKQFVIVSGMARGIDTAAHTGALEDGTIAVLPGGLNMPYPTENKGLYDKIAEKGLLLAESPFGAPPSASSFPRRNRLISGLSWGVLVVEAALKSGSLITAQCALDQGRDIFAVPGFPLDPRSQGCNRLIQDGAVLVQRVEDIQKNLTSGEEKALTALCLKEQCPDKTQTHPRVSMEDIRQTLLTQLSYTPIHMDTLLRACAFDPSMVHLALLEMDVAGLICRHPGHHVSLAFPEDQGMRTNIER